MITIELKAVKKDEKEGVEASLCQSGTGAELIQEYSAIGSMIATSLKAFITENEVPTKIYDFVAVKILDALREHAPEGTTMFEMKPSPCTGNDETYEHFESMGPTNE